MGEIRFYEGPGCTQHYIGKLASGLSRGYDLTQVAAPFGNGEAMSLTLIEVPEGVKIRLFDSAVPTAGEDCIEIVVRTFVEERCIPSFDQELVDAQVQINLHNGKGVQGKVARIEVQSS